MVVEVHERGRMNGQNLQTSTLLPSQSAMGFHRCPSAGMEYSQCATTFKQVCNEADKLVHRRTTGRKGFASFMTDL